MTAVPGCQRRADVSTRVPGINRTSNFPAPSQSGPCRICRQNARPCFHIPTGRSRGKSRVNDTYLLPNTRRRGDRGYVRQAARLYEYLLFDTVGGHLVPVPGCRGARGAWDPRLPWGPSAVDDSDTATAASARGQPQRPEKSMRAASRKQTT